MVLLRCWLTWIRSHSSVSSCSGDHRRRIVRLTPPHTVCGGQIAAEHLPWRSSAETVMGEMRTNPYLLDCANGRHRDDGPCTVACVPRHVKTASTRHRCHQPHETKPCTQPSSPRVTGLHRLPTARDARYYAIPSMCCAFPHAVPQQYAIRDLTASDENPELSGNHDRS